MCKLLISFLAFGRAKKLYHDPDFGNFVFERSKFLCYDNDLQIFL